jgi:hypothetical protein
MTQDAFRRVERSLRYFTFGATQSCAWFREEFPRMIRAPIRLCFDRRPRQFQRAIPYFGTTILLWLGHASLARLATCRGA